MTQMSVAFAELVRRAQARLPLRKLMFCVRCRRLCPHRIAARTSLGEDIWRCEHCGLAVTA